MHEEIQNDEQMERILKILNDIPEQMIPETLESRLKEALREEGENIRRLREAAERKTKKRKTIFRSLSTLAACLVVGVVSISMYNSMGIDIDQNENAKTAALYSEKATDNELNDTAIAEDAVKAEEPEEIYGAASGGAPESDLNEAPKAKSIAPKAAVAESIEAESRSVTAAEGSETDMNMALAAAAPEDPNLALIKEYLKTDQFTVVSVTPEVPDETTKEIVYEILLNVDKDGKPAEETIKLVVAEGVVNEQQPAE